MHILPFSDAIDTWDPTRQLTADELQNWVSIHRPPLYLDTLVPYEANNFAWVPLISHSQLPFIAIAREIHRQGYGRYFPDHELLPQDSAHRRILRADTDATQSPGVFGIAWMCYAKQGIASENDVYGLTYELAPPDDGSGDAVGWRALPIAKLFLPADQPSPLTQWGISRLDELEQAGATIVELSGISVRPTAPNPGLVFHEIMRRLVHQGIIIQAHGGPEKVLVFAMVEEVRDRVRVRMGADNFVPLGRSFSPPGKDVRDTIRLAPHIVEPSQFLERLASSHQKARGIGSDLTALVQGVLHYTRGLPWRYISQYPAALELLAEFDATGQVSGQRDVSTGWHDKCERNMDCLVCHPAVSVFDHIQRPHYDKYLIA
ncbi:MAG: hypothetical protein WBP22_03710 [Candidatus Saccharimonas sp.]